MYPAPYDPTPASSPPPPTGWHDRSIFEVMWAVRGKLITLSVLGFVVGVLLWAVRPSVYEAQAHVYVNRPSSTGSANPFRSDGATAAGVSAQEAVMKSNAVLAAVLAQPGIGDGPVLAEAGDPLSHLQKRVRIGVADDKETFTVRFRSTDPQEAADVVNAVVNQYVWTQRQRATNALGGTLDPALDRAADIASERLIGATGANTTGGAFAVNVASREMMSRLAEQQLSRLTQEVIDASLQLESAQSRVAAAEQLEGDTDALLQLAMDDSDGVQYDRTAIELIRRIEIALNTAQTRYRAAQKVLGPQHPVYRTYQSDVETLTQQLGDARQNAADNLRDTFAKAAQQAETRLERLSQRVATARAAAEQIHQLAIEVLDPAAPPRKPVSPKLVVHAAAGTLVGLLVATLLGLIGEVRRVAENHAAVEAEAGRAAAPGGFLPRPAAAYVRGAPQLGWDRPAPASDAPPLLGTIPRIAATHRLVGPGYDRAADSLHQTRAVLQAIARRHDIKSIAFVSPRRGTGRTSVTIGLASSFATAGTRVLAVDGDLSGRITKRHRANADREHPGQHDTNLAALAESTGHFDDAHTNGQAGHNQGTGNGDHHEQHQSHEPQGPLGFAGYLDGHPLDDCLKQARADGLAFLPANTAEERHLGVFCDRKIADLIDQTRDRFDLILFDSGPVPGSLESLTIASVTDGVVLVLEDSHDVAEFQRAMQHLRVINAKVLGVIVNKAGEPHDPAAPSGQGRDGQAADTDGPQDPHFASAGSGILAASVFTDAQAGYREDDWELTAVNDLLPDADLPEVEEIEEVQTKRD